jgi:hypothetical protein
VRRSATRAFVVCVLLAAGRVSAQAPAPAPPTDRVPVVLDGRQLFEVGESGTRSPAQRAAEVNRILRAAVADPEPVNLVLAEHEGWPAQSPCCGSRSASSRDC